jgi:hypothetical protein
MGTGHVPTLLRPAYSTQLLDESGMAEKRELQPDRRADCDLANTLLKRG